MERRITRDASTSWHGLRIALVYAAVGALWIVFSDLAVELVFGRTPGMFWAEVLKGLAFVSSSALLIFFLTRRTIQSIRQSEAALRESRRILSTLLSNLPGMVYRCKGDVNCPFDFVSSGALELTGYSPSELTDKQKLDDLILEEDRDLVLSETQEALAERRPFKVVYRIRSADGQVRWVWEQGLGVYSESGELEGIEGFITDISERKQAEEALKRSEEIYRALVEGTSDAIFMVDRDRNIVSINQGFVDLFGYSREELEGKSIRVLHPSDQSYARFGKTAYPALEKAPLRVEWDLRKKDGTVFPGEGTYSVIRGSDGKAGGHVGIIRDITQRKKAEHELEEYREHLEEMVKERTQELEEAQKALVQREKLKTLGTIAAEVAHEIRNPLVSIGGFARRLYKKNPQAHEAEIILQESGRLETMLDRLSEYLRPVEMRPREAYVNSILGESVSALAPELEKAKVAVHLDFHPDLPTAHVDPAVLSQIFVVMIRNALQLMNSEKELTLRTYSGERSVYVEMTSSTAGKKVTDPELMLLPFEDKGNATGFSSTFKLLRGMGGTLSVSRYNGRAVFTVSLVKCGNAQHLADHEPPEV